MPHTDVQGKSKKEEMKKLIAGRRISGEDSGLLAAEYRISSRTVRRYAQQYITETCRNSAQEAANQFYASNERGNLAPIWA
jgi:hypothetical protein